MNVTSLKADTYPAIWKTDEYPSISIITPNYNTGDFIEKCIQSVIEQNYPDLEFIIIDGGSTDGSHAAIQKYERYISHWEVKKGLNQSQAINYGIMLSKGEIINWLCSDDYLKPQALFRIAAEFNKSADIDVVAGRGEYLFLDSKKSWLFKPREDLDLIPAVMPCAQPSCFFKKSILRKVPLDETYDYVMDLELMAYLKTSRAKWKFTDALISVSVSGHHNKTSTGKEKIISELERLYSTYVKEGIPMTSVYKHVRFPLEKLMVKHPSVISKILLGPLWLAVTLFMGLLYGMKKSFLLSWRWTL